MLSDFFTPGCSSKLFCVTEQLSQTSFVSPRCALDNRNRDQSQQKKVNDVALQIERQEFIQSKIIDRVADEDDDLVFVEQKKKLVVDVRDKDDLELYYKTIPDYFEQDDGRKLTEIPDRTSTDMIEGRY